jgi:subtilisin family serine protease
MDSGVDVRLTDVSRAVPVFSALTDGDVDCAGHGTIVHAMAGGTKFGVAKAANLLSVRILDCDAAGKLSSAMVALDWLRANVSSRGTAATSVVNLSIATPLSSVLNAAIAGLAAVGVVVVVSAGNNKLDACTISPTSEPSAIVVGAVDVFDRRASYSNFGPCVDVYAPGSAIVGPDIHSPPSGEVTDSGTSYASPLVAGAVARVRQQFPGASASTIVATLLCDATAGIVRGNPANTANALLMAPAAAADRAVVATSAECVAAPCPTTCVGGSCR